MRGTQAWCGPLTCTQQLLRHARLCAAVLGLHAAVLRIPTSARLQPSRCARRALLDLPLRGRAGRSCQLPPLAAGGRPQTAARAILALSCMHRRQPGSVGATRPAGVGHECAPAGVDPWLGCGCGFAGPLGCVDGLYRADLKADFSEAVAPAQPLSPGEIDDLGRKLGTWFGSMRRVVVAMALIRPSDVVVPIEIGLARIAYQGALSRVHPRTLCYLSLCTAGCML